jgi:hypothetical protein
MSIERGNRAGPAPAGGEHGIDALIEERRARATGLLGLGTLACRQCDAPVAIGPEPRPLTHELSCPYCSHRAPAREFLSMSPDPRPARVTVRLRWPGL